MPAGTSVPEKPVKAHGISCDLPGLLLDWFGWLV